MNAIPPAVQTVLDLFTTALRDVRFADLDGQTLARLASDVEAASVALAAAQASLDVARDALQEKQDALLQQAQRALAYARVYAEADDVLSAQLEAVTLPRAGRRARSEDALVLSPELQPAPRPRGRPRKVPVTEPMLEVVASPAE